MATYVIPSAITKNMSDIMRFYDEYWDLRTFKNPLKESYLLSFVLLALVILMLTLLLSVLLVGIGAITVLTLLPDEQRIV